LEREGKTSNDKIEKLKLELNEIKEKNQSDLEEKSQKIMTLEKERNEFKKDSENVSNIG
jgi:FtsZ-binding cell division protein ZapB